MKRERIVVRGRVQGVFFRATTLEKAQGIGLAGFVMNQPDGSVLIEAEGQPGQIRQLKDWCYIGSRFSNVKSVDGIEIELKGESDFRIKH